MSIMTIGIDIAKNVFAVHGVDENGKPALIKPKVAREQLRFWRLQRRTRNTLGCVSDCGNLSLP